MKAKTYIAAFGLLIISLVSASLFAKGLTLKITLKGRRRFYGTAAAAFVLTFLLGSANPGTTQNSPKDYPQWRGQRRDGSASAFSEPASWPEKLTQRWKIEVGESYATPLVVGNAVYCFTRREGNEVMTALNAGSGRVLWQTDYPAPYKLAPPTRTHGAGPKATPLFYRNKLYTLGISGIVSAFDASTGKLVWQKPAPSEQPFFGTASSPVGENGLVIFYPGNYGPLTAFDTNTGEVKWTAKGDGAYASPIIVTLSGIRQIVSMGQTEVMGAAIQSGDLLWHYPWAGAGGGMQAITPVLYRGMIIVSSHGTGVAALKPFIQNGKWAVEPVWETKEVSMFLSNPVIMGDSLFGLSERSSGQYFALDANTGKVLWLGQPRQAANTAVVKAGPILFLLNDDGELIIAKASQSKFQQVKRYTVADGATWAQPAISGNRLFIKDVLSLTLWTVD